MPDSCRRCGAETVAGEILSMGLHEFLLCEDCCEWLLEEVGLHG